MTRDAERPEKMAMTASARWIMVIVIAGVIVAGGLSGAASRLQLPRQASDRPTVSGLDGQAVTLLPDGTYLLTGGMIGSAASASIEVQDPRSGARQTIGDGLIVARAGHTATLLPDGRVLIRGGIGGDGLVVRETEVLDLGTRQPFVVQHPVLVNRAYHTSTVLSDGRVLTIGGRTDDGTFLDDAEVWDPLSGASTVVADSLGTPRAGHVATIDADGLVHVSGGTGDGAVLARDEVFDPVFEAFVEAPFAAATPAEPSLAASFPSDGAVDVAPDVMIALRFSISMDVRSLNGRSIVLRDHRGGIPASVVPVERGRLVFVRPHSKLQHGTEYVLAIDGTHAVDGRPFRPLAIRFTTTAAPEESSANAIDDETWAPTAGHQRGEWRTGRPDSPWRQLPPLQAARGVTAIAGQVLLLNGRPLANVTLFIGSRTTQTDRSGRFLLENVGSGRQVLRIDGRTASRPNRMFGLFDVAVDAHAGRTNALWYAIWMPVLDTRNAVSIPSPTTAEVVVTTPQIPGLEVRIPPGTVIRDVDGQPVTAISITPIPVDRPPFPLPADVDVPVYFTIQPGSAILSSNLTTWPAGARLIYPNYQREPAGRRINFWQYDAAARGWFTYGQGTVRSDGYQIIPDERVVLYQFTGAMVAPESILPAVGREPGQVDEDGDPVDLSTGQFLLETTDLFIRDVIPIHVRRSYRPQDTASRAFGLGATHDYDMFMVGDTWPYTHQTLALPDGGRVRFERVSAGTSYSDAVYEHTTTPSRFYKAVLRWNGSVDASRAWRLTLKDGTTYFFPEAEGVTDPYRAALTGIADRNGNELIISRTYGRVDAIMSPNGRAVWFTYDESGRVVQLVDIAGRAVLYVYDAGGRLWKVTNPAGGVTEYSYDVSNRLTQIKDARGIVFLTNEYDTLGRVFRQTLGDSGVYQFAYTTNSNGRIVQTDVTDPRNVIRRMTFNAQGYRVSDTRAVGQPEEQVITWVLDSLTNLPTSMTDALNRQTTYTYDSAGNVLTEIRLAGTPDAVTTTYTYEPKFNQLATITDPLMHTWTFGYDGRGNMTTITDPLTHQRSMTYDTVGRVLTATNPMMQTTQYSYAGADLVQVTNPASEAMQMSYDALGRMISKRDALGRITSFAYDDLDRQTIVTDALGGITTMAYDPNGNLTSLTDAQSSPATTFTYDILDRLETRTDPLTHTETTVRDLLGNITRHTDRKGQATTYAYDPLNRRTFSGFGTIGPPESATHESTVTTTFDDGNRVVTQVDSQAGNIERTYDGLDRLLTESTPQGVVTYTYDAAGRRTSLTVTGQPSVTYTYDNANRLQTIQQGPTTVTYAYDDANRRTSVTLPNGILVENGYDTASRVTSVTYRQNGVVLGDLTYTYNAVGERVQVGGTFARTGLPSPVADAVYDEANRPTTFNGITLAHDLNGNLTVEGQTTYTWDVRNRLVNLTGPGLSGNFSYDAEGRRVSKTLNGSQTGFLYDGWNPVQELTGTSPSANLLTGLELDAYLGRDIGDGIRSYLTDAVGTTVALTTPSGALETTYTYEPYGNQSAAGASTTNMFGFTGRELDAQQLLHYRHRYYSAKLQRFLAEDPAGCVDGTNLYAYVGNSPTMFTDPLGLERQDCLGSIDNCLGSCLSQVLGLETLLAAVGAVGGMPLLPKRFVTPGSSPGTSVWGRIIGRGPNVGRGLPAPTFGVPWSATPWLGRFVSRWIPIIGWAGLALDAYQLGQCMNDCLSPRCR